MEQLPPLSEVVRKFGLQPSKSYGQNFLFDLNLTARIARSAGDLTNFTILEIGPGPGGLTRSLLECGAREVVAVEYDPRCIAALNQIKELVSPRLTVIEADALHIKEQELVPEKSKIVANLPYNIATVLLFKWLENIDYYSSLTLMFQKEVVERLTAKTRSKEYGRLSVMTQFFANVTHQFDISPSAFYPPPKVTSSVVNIVPRTDRRKDVDPKILSKICQIVFGQRRKMLRSSLKPFIPNLDEFLAACNIRPEQRPEELSVDDFCNLAYHYKNFS